MKAIILAGGSGTRLYPITRVINKHFLPIYNKPMIYYPLSLVMLLGIREVIFIVNSEDVKKYQQLLGDGSNLGMQFQYIIQDKPRGLAEGLLLAEHYIKKERFLYLLGDNIFFGHNLIKVISEAIQEVKNKGGAYIFGYYVKDPERFGIVEFNDKGNVISIEEKPKKPKSNYAITGLYIFDEKAIEYAKNIKPSNRGELEITSVLEMYWKNRKLKVKLLGRGFAWFDAGVYDSFLEASNFIATIEKKTGLMIGCIEEIAYKNGWIDENQLLAIAKKLQKTEYGKYLLELVQGGII